MRRKNIFLMVAAVMTILMWSGAAFAVNTATLNVTSEPIHYQAVSDKAGGLTIIFDADTALVVGDVITMDLPLNVSLAQTINLEVSPSGAGTPYAAVPVADGPFIDPTAAATVTGGGVYFRVTGTVGTQRVTIEILGAVAGDSIMAGPGVDDRLELTILDQRVNLVLDPVDGWINAGIWVAGAAVPTNATLAQNTLCINVSMYAGEYVNGSFDSAGDKFTFVPSNPQIAHVVAQLAINFDPCKGQSPGYIEIGDRITQGNDTCDAFDNDYSSAGIDGFCWPTHTANDVILEANNPFDPAQYVVQLDILVNGQGGNNGVYWTNEMLYADGYATNPGCGLQHQPIMGSYSYRNGNGVSVSAAAPNNNNCDVSVIPDNRAVQLTSPQGDLSLLANSDYLAFNFPAMNYDLDDIMPGDVVSVTITILKVPCGTVFTGTWTIGTFGCQSSPQSDMLSFPYFTDMDGSDAYWDGLVITNMGSADAMCTVMVYEADGDVGMATVTVGAMSQYVNLLSNIMWTQTGGMGMLGDSSCYIIVNAIGSSMMDGFGMMARQDTGESMGYLPRR